RVDGFSRGVFVHLRYHRGHEIEGLPDLRKLLEDAHHAVVVLERMHARPRKLVLARDEVLVIRLVHMPEETQVNSRHFVVGLSMKNRASAGSRGDASTVYHSLASNPFVSACLYPLAYASELGYRPPSTVLFG